MATVKQTLKMIQARIDKQVALMEEEDAIHVSGRSYDKDGWLKPSKERRLNTISKQIAILGDQMLELVRNFTEAEFSEACSTYGYDLLDHFETEDFNKASD